MPSLKPGAELWALLCTSRVAGATRGHGDHSDCEGEVRQGMGGRLAHGDGDYSHQNRERAQIKYVHLRGRLGPWGCPHEST